jgi:hypothetical protein
MEEQPEPQLQPLSPAQRAQVWVCPPSIAASVAVSDTLRPTLQHTAQCAAHCAASRLLLDVLLAVLMLTGSSAPDATTPTAGVCPAAINQDRTHAPCKTCVILLFNTML